jgi:MFS family permease
MLGHGVFRPILPIFARRLGATGLEVGLLTSGFMVARAITAFAVGKRIDISGKKKIFINLGFFIIFIIAFGYFFMSSYHGILFLRFCQGICSGLMWPAAQIMVVEQADKKFRTRALSLYQITGKIGGLLSRVFLYVILLITAHYGFSEIASFRTVFIIGGAILFIGFLETLSIPEHKTIVTQRRKGRPPYSIFLLGFAFGAMLAIGPISLVFLNEHYGITPAGIAILLLVLDALTITAMYGSSHLSDKIGIRRSLWFVLIPCFLSAIYLPIVAAFIVFVIFYFVMRMAISSFMPIARAYASSFDTEVGSNIGTLNMMTNFGSVVGPIVAGLLYDNLYGGFKIAGYSVIALLLIPGALILLYPYLTQLNKEQR